MWDRKKCFRATKGRKVCTFCAQKKVNCSNFGLKAKEEKKEEKKPAHDDDQRSQASSTLRQKRARSPGLTRSATGSLGLAPSATGSFVSSQRLDDYNVSEQLRSITDTLAGVQDQLQMLEDNQVEMIRWMNGLDNRLKEELGLHVPWKYMEQQNSQAEFRFNGILAAISSLQQVFQQQVMLTPAHLLSTNQPGPSTLHITPGRYNLPSGGYPAPPPLSSSMSAQRQPLGFNVAGESPSRMDDERISEDWTSLGQSQLEKETSVTELPAMGSTLPDPAAGSPRTPESPSPMQSPPRSPGELHELPGEDAS
jgi:hypothetical protein